MRARTRALPASQPATRLALSLHTAGAALLSPVPSAVLLSYREKDVRVQRLRRSLMHQAVDPTGFEVAVCVPDPDCSVRCVLHELAMHVCLPGHSHGPACVWLHSMLLDGSVSTGDGATSGSDDSDGDDGGVFSPHSFPPSPNARTALLVSCAPPRALRGGELGRE